ncbi:hypothetical protein ACFL0U_01140 [Pseudomonadota bacterium]
MSNKKDINNTDSAKNKKKKNKKRKNITYKDRELKPSVLKKLKNKDILFKFIENKNNLNTIRVHRWRVKKEDLYNILEVTVKNLDLILDEIKERINVS